MHYDKMVYHTSFQNENPETQRRKVIGSKWHSSWMSRWQASTVFLALDFLDSCPPPHCPVFHIYFQVRKRQWMEGKKWMIVWSSFIVEQPLFPIFHSCGRLQKQPWFFTSSCVHTIYYAALQRLPARGEVQFHTLSIWASPFTNRDGRSLSVPGPNLNLKTVVCFCFLGNIWRVDLS